MGALPTPLKIAAIELAGELSRSDSNESCI